ncbi:ATP-binding protein [Litchfieldella xinjiangensis]|uniref:sensor histidine kinase n=1 Tax=Litchfieldella xinjiangensis TaxID=1166948 RepID=UPI0005B7F262|nr:ATP-binding protein [Halomonas xinjiangensis]
MPRIPDTTWHNLAFILAFVMLIGLGWQAARTQQALLEANQAVTGSLELISAVQNVLSTVQDVETGERGYVITGEVTYLRPYHQALTRLPEDSQSLQRLLQQRGNIEPEWYARLEFLMLRRLSIAEANVAVRELEGREAASLRLLAAGGRQTMDQIRGQLGALEAKERSELARDNRRLERQVVRSRWLGGIGVATVILIFCAALWSVNRNLALRRKLAREAQQGEARVAALLRAVPDELFSIHPPDSVERLDRNAKPAAVPAGLKGEFLSRLAADDDRDRLHSFVWHDDHGNEFEVRMVPAGEATHLAIVRDVTERLRTRRRLLDQRTFLRSVVDADENLIFARDIQGRFQLTNIAFAEFLGLEPGQLEGKRPAELRSGHLLVPLLSGDSELLAGRPELRVPEVEVESARGEIRCLQLLKRPLTLSDGSRYLLAVAVDITQRREIEKVKAEFISTVSHELRTPLTAIRGAMGMLAQGMAGDFPREARPLIDIANKNSERLSRLINDILDIEKLESGRLDFNLQPMRLLPLVRQAIHDNDPYAATFGVSLELHEDPADGWVRVDADRLAQVMANLLSNACKFSPREGIVTLEVLEVNMAGKPMLEVGVSDRGPGIPEAYHHRIFERFVQVDSSDRRRLGGTGLGLAITQTLMAEMDGEVGFTSESGQGTRFYVRFPCIAGLETHEP